MALDLATKNGFRAISFEYIGELDSYFIHRYIIINYRLSSITDKIHQLLSMPYLCKFGNRGGHPCPMDTFLVCYVFPDI